MAQKEKTKGTWIPELLYGTKPPTWFGIACLPLLIREIKFCLMWTIVYWDFELLC